MNTKSEQTGTKVKKSMGSICKTSVQAGAPSPKMTIQFLDKYSDFMCNLGSRLDRNYSLCLGNIEVS